MMRGGEEKPFFSKSWNTSPRGKGWAVEEKGGEGSTCLGLVFERTLW